MTKTTRPGRRSRASARRPRANAPQARFELDAQIEAIKLGGIPGGTRFDLRYLEAEKMDPPPPPAFTFRHDTEKLTGRVVAGHDWALVRDVDDIVIFDGRITIILLEKPLSVIARVQGRTTMGRVKPPTKRANTQPQLVQPELAQGKWRKGLASGTTLPLEVVVQFTADVSQEIPKGLVALESKLYFGFGTYTFEASADRIKIDAFDAASVRTWGPKGIS
jgi:hypothetical protein